MYLQYNNMIKKILKKNQFWTIYPSLGLKWNMKNMYLCVGL
jgi:hypothetical protein